MNNFDKKKYPIYANFLNQLAKDLTRFYYSKLDKPFFRASAIISSEGLSNFALSNVSIMWLFIDYEHFSRKISRCMEKKRSN